MKIEESSQGGKSKILYFLNQPFNLVNKKIYVTGCVVFVACFLLLFTPFDLQKTFLNGHFNLISFFFIVFEILSTFLGLYFSQYFLRDIFYKRNMTILRHFVLLLVECGIIVLLIAIFGIVFSLFYTLTDDLKQNLIQNQFLNTLYIYMCHFLILIFPFSGVLFWSKFYDTNSQKKNLAEEIIQLNTQKQFTGNKVVSIVNDKDKVELEIPIQRLLYVEAENQYVMIYYLFNNKIEKRLIRNRLKAILQQMGQSQIIQCHRSFAINLDRADRIIVNNGNRFIVLKENDNIQIPVSKTYFRSIKDRLVRV